ncbi:MAG: helix-turn-helix transcriptional regulator [Paenirhodobacter sp.]|uniref:helix-turn-helix transcriptional regulator n=1 Tax=Paenirhodobacter sp. TaxID=1965326 RepID=UPI003D0F7F55
MSRSDRLFRLLDAMRRLPAPLTAARLAEETGVSERTLYRDIEALRAGGARIEGEAGYGYTLAEDPALPPQNLTRLEIEALTLGIAELRHLGDPALARAGEMALAKITATLPETRAHQAAHAVLSSYRFERRASAPVDLEVIRAACWEERALDLRYRDAGGAETARRIWPLGLVYLDRELMLLAWCGLRQDFRKFIVARMVAIAPADESFRPRRVALLRAFTRALTAGRC